MKIRKSIRVVFLCPMLGLAICGCPSNRPTEQLFEANRVLFDTVAQAERMTLYEGLPHQMIEKALFAEEKKTKETVELHGFPFYRRPLVLKEEDKKHLVSLLADKKSFIPYGGARACGGFHPDYCLEWSVGAASYQALLCFGCREAKGFASQMEIHCDIESEATEQFKAVLKPYRQNRPLSDYNKE